MYSNALENSSCRRGEKQPATVSQNIASYLEHAEASEGIEEEAKTDSSGMIYIEVL